MASLVAGVILAAVCTSAAEQCSTAGLNCCKQAPQQCPHPESGAKCMDEIHKGISNGPQCKNNYINTHCVAGRKYTCLIRQQCDCSSLRRPALPKVRKPQHQVAQQQQQQQQQPKIRKVAQKRRVAPSPGQVNASSSNSRCGAAGRSCCRSAAERCPYPNSGEACRSEIHAGVQQGPKCRQNYINSHCKADGMFSCNSQHQCDCFLEEENGSIERLYAISAGAASNFPLPRNTAHSAAAVGATIASAALVVATFSLLTVLVTWSVRRRAYANFRTSIDESLSTDSEDRLL